MHLSIIIVNYNVKFFLEQCLCSVQEAIKNLEAEVWVVDNASKDGSVDYLQPRFPFVKFISNTENVGFSHANNQALASSSGAYVLFLNPDTIVPEDCFEKCISFLENNKRAGALGVKMVDGCGNFLPESKRSFPSPITSLFKLVGLTALFPKSKIFARYSLGHLDENQTHEVDVLAGAFLMARRNILQDLKGFDETFFMYGEDIDLSYRIQKSGFKNYYFADTTIIHFKGESTKKGSLNYIRMFYNAMSVFVSKHYSGGKAWIFRFFIQIAIWLRAGVTAILSFIGRIGLPLVDAILIYGSFELVKHLWITYARGGEGYGADLVNVALPGFTIIFLLSATLAGIYDRRYKPAKAFYSASVAIIIMLAAYSLLPERFRFSRAVILFGGFTALFFITSLRWLLLKGQLVDDSDESKKHQRTLIVGEEQEYNHAHQLLSEAGLQHRVLGRIAVSNNKTDSIGTVEQIGTLVETIGVKELIFCEGYLSFRTIIEIIQQLPSDISTRFFSANSNSIVGSDSKDTSGQSVSIEGNYNLSIPYQRRMKKIIDILFALFILITFPLHLLLFGVRILENAFHVLLGKRTWVGYAVPDPKLPTISTGVLSTNGRSSKTHLLSDSDSLAKIDFWYAKKYEWIRDLKIILKNYKYLGNK
ncbi:MAG TPA: glycosyltransferase [Segetibacter sp.]